MRKCLKTRGHCSHHSHCLYAHITLWFLQFLQLDKLVKAIKLVTSYDTKAIYTTIHNPGQDNKLHNKDFFLQQAVPTTWPDKSKALQEFKHHWGRMPHKAPPPSSYHCSTPSGKAFFPHFIKPRGLFLQAGTGHNQWSTQELLLTAGPDGEGLKLLSLLDWRTENMGNASQGRAGKNVPYQNNWRGERFLSALLSSSPTNTRNSLEG